MKFISNSPVAVLSYEGTKLNLHLRLSKICATSGDLSRISLLRLFKIEAIQTQLTHEPTINANMANPTPIKA